MKNRVIAIVIAVALLVGYRWLSDNDQQAVNQQKAERETLITTQQTQAMDQAKQLGKQMQNDVDTRMKSVDDKHP